MDAESPESDNVTEIALNFPVNDSDTGSMQSTPRIPRRLRRRLLEAKNPSTTAQDIEAKLRDAELRRQQFYENLSSKARTNLRSLTWSSTLQDEELGQQLEAKLSAAEQERQRGTILALAKAYADLKINGESVKRMTFEQFASKIESTSIIQMTKALLDRLEIYIIISHKILGASSMVSSGNIDHLLKRVAIPSKGVNVDKTTQKCSSSGKEKIDTVKLPRYPVRVVLSAYMIFGHPNMVYIGNGQDENALAESAGIFVKEFDLLIKVILEWPIQSPLGETVHPTSDRLTFRSQLEAFDKAWCSFLYSFVTWKVKDAKVLEKDLVRAACQLEHSMLQAGKWSGEDFGDHMPEMKNLQKQVAENQKVLREKLQQLAGEGGIKRLEHALHESRSRFADKTESSSLLSSSYRRTPSSGGLLDNSPSNDVKKCDVEEDIPSAQHNGGSLLKLHSSSSNQNDSLTPKKTENFTKAATIPTQNEILVNEIIHECHGLDIINESQSSIKKKVSHTVEKAFWDGVIDSMKQNEPDYSWVLKLIKEVQDELCKMSPSSWREDIVETIDIDILSQMLNAGILDIDYLGRILDYSLLTLQKLCAPDDEDELKCAHQKLLQELADIPQAADKSNTKFALVVVQGLRFVLQQIQRLKHSINKARIRMLEPYVKGRAGAEYLRNSFSNQYGPPSEASASLPLVKELLSALISEFENEWNDHFNSLSALGLSNERYSQDEAPSTLRAGGGILREPETNVITSTTAGVEQPECKGEKVDLLVRLGLLKLVAEIEGLTVETLPETLKLNFYRLRAAQSELQKIIAIGISILIFRQTLLTEHLVSSPEDMEILMGKCITRLYELVDNKGNAGISELVESMSSCLESDEPEKSRARKEVVKNMLVKSLRAEDTVFKRISHALRLATRGVLLGGSGSKGKKLAENALKRVGASVLTEKLAETVQNLLVIANVSSSVHRAWYEEVLRNL